MANLLEVDGRQGEGGGQLLRTSLSLSAITGRPFHMFQIRAGRSKPGLRPQHLTAVRAVAAVCQADLQGDALNSQALTFRPRIRPQGGEYRFDVAEVSRHGSAGAVTLVFQAVLWPLLFAESKATLRLFGGTHVPFSPCYHYLDQVTRPAYAHLGAHFHLQLQQWGWYPAGGGEMRATVEPIQELVAHSFHHQPAVAVAGLAAVTNLPAHIPQRMARRAHNLLLDAGLDPSIKTLRATGRAPGAGLVLWRPQAGFTSLGRKGLPAAQVAETAVVELLAFEDNKVAVDPYLADQLLLPLALAHRRAEFTTNRLTQHLFTNAGLLRQWLGVQIDISGEVGSSGEVSVTGVGWQPAGWGES